MFLLPKHERGWKSQVSNRWNGHENSPSFYLGLHILIVWAVGLVISRLLVYLPLPLVALPSQTLSSRKVPALSSHVPPLPALCSHPLCFWNPCLQLISSALVSQQSSSARELHLMLQLCHAGDLERELGSPAKPLSKQWCWVVNVGSYTQGCRPGPALRCGLPIADCELALWSVLFPSRCSGLASHDWAAFVTTLLQCQETPSFTGCKCLCLRFAMLPSPLDSPILPRVCVGSPEKPYCVLRGSLV